MSATIPAIVLSWAGVAAATGPDYAREVRPILSNRCFKCHGPDDGNREAGLRLDERDAALGELDSGHRAIVPGHPDDSELIARIVSDDPDLVMPPPHTKVSLTPDEKRILTEWVAAGAAYAPHWAFVRPETPAVPEVAPALAGWLKNPIDTFVLQRLQAEGLAPSPEVDKATLCRRVYLDLVGLSPSPAELDAFLSDPSPDAYERLVDRLLASPRYGERWARRWLDLARYADTNGYEKDRDRSIWPYRDWVIRALNDDMPFDEFTVKQLAGDLLPSPTADDIVATGFHRNTMINEEGGIDPLEFRYLAVVDRVNTTGAAWLGLTFACAQCHTHKFDPITHTDYFGVFAMLNNADEPEWLIPGPELDQRRVSLTRQIDEAWRTLPDKWPAKATAAPEQVAGSGEPGTMGAVEQTAAAQLAQQFEDWQREEAERAVAWNVVRPATMKGNVPRLAVRDDGTIVASGDFTKSDTYEIVLPPSSKPVRSIRLEVLPDESLPNHGPGITWYEGPPGSFFLSEFKVSVGGSSRQVASATHSIAWQKDTAAAAIDGEMSTGWNTHSEQGQPHAAVFVLAEPVMPGEPITVSLFFERHFSAALGCFRLSVTDEESAEARGLTAAEELIMLKDASERTPEEKEAVFRRFLARAPELAEPMKSIRWFEGSMRSGTRTLVLKERPTDNPRKTFRHHRGEYTQPKEEVQPATPSFLPPLPPGVPPTRLGLAKWLVAPENPLTARVAVNRHWQAFFGRGFVPSLEDLGHQSETPSHPHLLDWLATTYSRDLAWSTKKLHRLIVTSATYRQASAVPAALVERDPKNLLLARGPRIRLEAEVIRDSLLKAAGLLSEKMYGPGVRPPQPAGVTEVAYGEPKWVPSGGEDRYRRSVYTFQKRTAPFAMTTTFDGPTGEACVPRRDVSNSALQSLTLLNDPMFVEVAQALGRVVANAGADDKARLRDLARRVLAREFDDTEASVMKAFLDTQRRRVAAGELDAKRLAGADAPDAQERAVWMLAARLVMNLDETVVKK